MSPLISTLGSIPLLCLERDPDCPVARQQEVALTLKLERKPRGRYTYQKIPISLSTQDKSRCPGNSSNVTLRMKSQHEGALTPLCTVLKNPQVPNTARQVACNPVNSSSGKRSSMPQHKMRPDSPVSTLQGPCDRSLKWRGTLSFLPQLGTRPSSIAPNPVESREAPPNSTVFLTSQRHPEKLPELIGTSRGNPGFPAATQERPCESFFNGS